MYSDKRNKRELLENRLIDFAISVNKMIENLPSTYLGKTCQINFLDQVLLLLSIMAKHRQLNQQKILFTR